MMRGRHHSSKLPDEGHEQQAGWARLRQATGNRSGRIRLAAAAVGVCAIITGVSMAAFSSPAERAGQASGGGANSGPSTATAQTTPPQAPVSSRGTTGPGLTRAGIAKTALQVPPGRQHQMVVWKKGPGGAAWSAVTTQLGEAMQAGGVRLYPLMRLSCMNLGSSVKTAQAAPPIPDRAMRLLYASVLAGLSSAAADCGSAISIHPDGDEGLRININKALLSRSLAEFAADSKKLYTATAAIRTLSR
jgi:hypothetical protein